jgi:hypothetical protein
MPRHSVKVTAFYPYWYASNFKHDLTSSALHYLLCSSVCQLADGLDQSGKVTAVFVLFNLIQ